MFHFIYLSLLLKIKKFYYKLKYYERIIFIESNKYFYNWSLNFWINLLLIFMIYVPFKLGALQLRYPKIE